jgi:RNA polymerase sigma-70 factor, ECF subfamily
MELFERFARGELAAFETLFRQFERQVQGYIVRLVRDQAVAEELTVETFWRAHRARACFDPGRSGDARQSFGGWLRRIATNLAIDHLRRDRREVPLSDDQAALPAPATEAVLEREQREAIARAFRQLPPSLRVAATLALVEEQKHSDIADALGISVGAVKNRIFRAVRLLRRRLEQLGVKP